MIRTIAITGALAFAVAGVAQAQTAPATAAAPADTAAPAAARPWAERAAALALRGAYHAIAEAAVLGSSPYLDAAKTHYRGALARYGRHDAGAASEAMAAAALARAAIAEHPAPAPRDIPAPPEIAAMAPADGSPGAAMRPGGMRGGGPGMRGPAGMGSGGPGGAGGRGRYGPWRGGRGRFDPARVASDARLANTAEAKELAQKALDADVARTRAAFSGNLDEAMRQGRLASDLALAVRSLARADHPPAFGRRFPSRARGGAQQRTGGIVGSSDNG